VDAGIANLRFGYYCPAMTTISLKLPDSLEARLTAEAKRRRTTTSAIVREAVEQAFAKKKKFVSCADLAGDLAGSLRGPRDASTNKKHLEDFGFERRHRTR
jgi:predicted transcriptional regulator